MCAYGNSKTPIEKAPLGDRGRGGGGSTEWHFGRAGRASAAIFSGSRFFPSFFQGRELESRARGSTRRSKSEARTGGESRLASNARRTWRNFRLSAVISESESGISAGSWRWTTSIIPTRDNRELCDREREEGGRGRGEKPRERENEISEVFEARTIKEEFRAEAGGRGRFPREDIWRERREREERGWRTWPLRVSNKHLPALEPAT